MQRQCLGSMFSFYGCGGEGKGEIGDYGEDEGKGEIGDYGEDEGASSACTSAGSNTKT